MQSPGRGEFTPHLGVDLYNGITDGIFKIIVDEELVWSDYLN